MNTEQPGAYDIAIVGSGISCTAFLIQFLEKLQTQDPKKKPVSIAVIEKAAEFWKGLPYGGRSSHNSLTITTLGEFIPPSEKESFFKWLEENLDHWIGYLRKNGEETGNQWVKNNALSIEKRQWEEMYVPRYLFGDYVKSRVIAAIEATSRKNLAVVTTMHADAKDISQLKAGYEIVMEDSNGKTVSISAGKVVLAIGSPPVRVLELPDPSPKAAYVYINDTYSPSLELNLKCIKAALSAIKEPSRRNMLILGSNASSLELLYMCSTRPGLKKLFNKIVLLSYSGKLPYRITPNKTNGTPYKFEHVLHLKATKNFTPDELITTFEKDIAIAEGKGVHIGNVYHVLNDLVVSLLKDMDEAQQKFFYDYYGQRFSKLIRRAGAEYRDAADALEKAGQLECIAGSFQKLGYADTLKEEGIRLTYKPAGGRNEVLHPLEFPLIINCGGAEELSTSASGFIQALISKKLCVVNNTNRGVEVNENFESVSRGLYVTGPLLGGIFNSKARLWHVENAKSIFYLGGLLAEVLLNLLEL